MLRKLNTKCQIEYQMFWCKDITCKGRRPFYSVYVKFFERACKTETQGIKWFIRTREKLET